MERLETLDFTGNAVRDIQALANLTALRVLEASNNHISEISSLSQLTALVELGISKNLILDTSRLYPLTEKNLRYVDIEISQEPPLQLMASPEL